MVYTQAQAATFWTGNDGMRCHADTIPWLRSLGLTHPEDLNHWDDEMLKDVKNQATKPIWVTVPADGDEPEHMAQRPPPVFSPLSFRRIKCAMKAIQYYHCVGRPLTAS